MDEQKLKASLMEKLSRHVGVTGRPNSGPRLWKYKNKKGG